MSKSHSRRSSGVSKVSLFATSATTTDDVDDGDKKSFVFETDQQLVDNSKKIGEISQAIAGVKRAQLVSTDAPTIVTGDPEAASDPELIQCALDTQYPYDKDSAVDNTIKLLTVQAMTCMPPMLLVQMADEEDFTQVCAWLERVKVLKRRGLEEFKQNSNRYFKRISTRHACSDNENQGFCMYFIKNYFFQIEFVSEALVCYFVHAV